MKNSLYNNDVQELYQSVQKQGIDSLAPEQQYYIIALATLCLESRLKQKGNILDNTQTALRYVQYQYAHETKREVFGVLFLDNNHQLLAFEKLFYGTVNQCLLYPRIVVQRALALNAAAIILAHNHLSANVQPSQADIKITHCLRDLLNKLDIRLCDHIIVSGDQYVMFSQERLL